MVWDEMMESFDRFASQLGRAITGGFSMADFFGIFIGIGLVVVLGAAIFFLIKSQFNLGDELRRNQSAHAVILAKHITTTEDDFKIYTKYYVTFEIEGGIRREFAVPKSEYEALAENEAGKLVWYDKRYVRFKKT